MKHLLLAAVLASLVACGGDEGSETKSAILQSTDDAADSPTPNIKKEVAISNLTSFINNGRDPYTESKASILVPLLKAATEAELMEVSDLVNEMLAAFEVENTVLPEVTTTLIKAMGGDTPEGVEVHTTGGFLDSASQPAPGFDFYSVAASTDNVTLSRTQWTYTSKTYTNEPIDIYYTSDNTDIDKIQLGTIYVGKGNNIERNNLVLMALTKGKSTLSAADLTNQIVDVIHDYRAYASRTKNGATVIVDELTEDRIQVSFHQVSGTEVIIIE